MVEWWRGKRNSSWSKAYHISCQTCMAASKKGSLVFIEFWQLWFTEVKLQKHKSLFKYLWTFHIDSVPPEVCFSFVPQRTWSLTQPPWRLATQRWVATSPSLLTPTMLPMKNCRHDTQRTWMKPCVQSGSSITDWHPLLGTKKKLLPQTKTTNKPCLCSKQRCLALCQPRLTAYRSQLT